MQDAKPEQTTMNASGTNPRSDTPLTRDGSRPVRYELIGGDGRSYGQFGTAEAAARYAYDMWPLQTQDEERTEGWDIQVVGS